MKKNLFWFLSVALLSCVLILPGCENDPCQDVSCGDNASCDEGICICFDGYEGDLCDQQWRDKYLGSYNVDESCIDAEFPTDPPTTDSYSNTIDVSSVEDAPDIFIITNFGNSGLSVTCRALGSGNFEVVEGTELFGEPVTGSGTYLDGFLTMDYDVPGFFNCSVEATKQ